MAVTHEHIATATAPGGGATSYMEVTAIDQTYDDLEVIIQSKTDTSTGASTCNLTFNNAGGTAYSQTRLRKNGTTMYGGIWNGASSFSVSYALGPGNGSQMSGWLRLYIPQYSSSLWEHPVNWWMTSWDSTTAGEMAYTGGLYEGTSAETITSIKWATSGWAIEGDCTMAVYGIKNA